MNIIIYILIALVVGIGGFFGGERIQAVHDEKLPPKYETTYNIQDVKSKTEVQVRSEQGQWTAIITVQGKTNASFFNYQINAHTNISFSHQVQTNKTARSNADKILKTLNLPGLPIP